MNYYRDCSSSSSRNTNKARGRQWNRFTAPGTPSGIDLDAVDGNRSQSGTPRGKSHSERELSGNNLISAGTPTGNNLPKGSPMRGDPPIKKKLKVGRGGVRPPPPGSEPMFASNYRAKDSNEQKLVARNIAACFKDGKRPDYHSRVQIYESPDERRKKEDAAALTNVDAQEEFERHSPPDNLKIFIEALPNICH